MQASPMGYARSEKRKPNWLNSWRLGRRSFMIFERVLRSSITRRTTRAYEPGSAGSAWIASEATSEPNFPAILHGSP